MVYGTWRPDPLDHTIHDLPLVIWIRTVPCLRVLMHLSALVLCSYQHQHQHNESSCPLSATRNSHSVPSLCLSAGSSSASGIKYRTFVVCLSFTSRFFIGWAPPNHSRISCSNCTGTPGHESFPQDVSASWTKETAFQTCGRGLNGALPH